MNNETEIISIVIPVYNCEKHIERCINSILKQTYKNLEIVLVNDGSKDKSLEICEKYAQRDNRILIFNKENEGVSSARNLGIEKSHGEFISFVDSDDYLEETFCEELINKLYEYDVDYVACGYKRVYNDKHIEYVNNDFSERIVSPIEYLNELLNVQKGYGFAHMKLIKKEVIGDIKFDIELKVGEDALFNVMLCEKLKKILIYNKALYNYYFNSNSVVRKFDNNYDKKYIKSMERMTQYINLKYKDNTIIKENLQNYIAYHVLLICVNFCYHPENENKGIKLLKKICNYPIFKTAIKHCSYSNLSLTRKISLFALKHKLYYAMKIICEIRQKQFEK